MKFFLSFSFLVLFHITHSILVVAKLYQVAETLPQEVLTKVKFLMIKITWELGFGIRIETLKKFNFYKNSPIFVKIVKKSLNK